ncbi:hypothetical protein GGF46_005221 [Coemansia sp. RSA 552]|nr:hypothetical protein GGF46_005221 [Coemansia sp. RSA 552]
MTRQEAICALAKVVIQAARPYVNLLRNIASATGVPDHVVVDPGIVRQYQSDINAYVGQFDWLKNNVVTEADAPTITYLLPELITLLDDVLGCQSVVVVDEYDRPYMHLIRARDIDTTTRGHIMEMYTCFLSACLKDRDNNVQAYFAHSDMGSYVPQSNPFERAFGFTLAEVQGLLDAYVQGKWTKKYPGANAVQFGQELLMHCTRFYDGYCIGNSAHMFNPHAILSFVQGLEKKLPPSTSVLKVQTAWADTGSTRVIETMMTNDICTLQGYICPLMDEYSHRFNCRWGESLDSNVLFPMPASQAADDYDSAAIAKVCLSEDPLALDKALAASEHGYNVDAVLLILYQAGYIAPVSSNRVAIPNMEVLLALVDFVGRLSQRHILCDYTALDTGLAGLLEANLAKFADGCNAQIITLPLFRIGMLEADYQMILAIYFAPLCMAGIRVQCEECTGNGRTDIVVSPEPVASRKSSTAPPYWVFELKRYPEKLTAAYKKMKNQERMSRDNRLKMAKGAFDEARKACDQIICLYLASAKAKSSTIGSDWIYSVSMAFWFNRFCLIATRYQRCTGDDGRVSWNPVSFAEDDDGNVSPADSLEYEDINDNLDPENGSTVRTKILGGSIHLVHTPDSLYSAYHYSHPPLVERLNALDNPSVGVDVERDDKISRLKERVEEKEGIPPSQQRLIYSGKQCKDDEPIETYVGTTSPEKIIFHLVLALRGGVC